MKRNTTTRDERGQAYALEGITSAILLITAIVLAINATAITPLTASTSNQQIEEQNRIISEDLLDATVENEALQKYLVEEYDGETETTVYDWENSDNEFERIMYDALGGVDINVAFNIYVTYENQNGEMITEQAVDQGEPSDHAATASRTVVIHDHMVDDNEAEYIPQMDGYDDGDQSVYNVVEVQLEVWRM